MEGDAYTGTERLRAAEIIDHLASLPGLNDESPLYVEYSIMNYLAGTCGRSAVHDFAGTVFPGLGRESVMKLLLWTLDKKTESEVFPVLRRFIDETDFTFLDRYSHEGAVANDRRRLALYNVVKGILSDKKTSHCLNSPFTVIAHNIVEKYLAETGKRSSALYESLLTFSGEKLEVREAIIIYKTVLIAMCGFVGGLIVRGAEKMLQGIPELVADTAVSAVNVMREAGPVPGPADFVAILYFRFRNADFISEGVKGCLPPDRSWLETAMISRMPCFHRGILELMLGIACDKGW